MPNGPVVRTSDFGLSENQFGRLLTIIQGCLGSNNVQPQQATPPVANPRQAEPALSRNEQRPIQQRLGNQLPQEDLQNLLDRRTSASQARQEGNPNGQRAYQEEGNVQLRVPQQIAPRARDHEAETIPVVRLDELPADVAIHPRTGEMMNAEEIYAQQKALEAQILSLGRLVKDHEQIHASTPNPLCDEIMKEQ